MKNQMNLKTKIEFKRAQAVRAIKAYWKLYETNPEEFRASAKRHNSIPIDLRRDKKGRDKQFELLNDQGIVIKRRGRIREGDIPINKEVETSYNFLRSIRNALHANHSAKSKKIILNLLRFKPPSSAISLEKLPDLSLDSVEEWQPWFILDFMNRHKNRPENDPELKNLVFRRVKESGSSKKQSGSIKKQSGSIKKPAELRNQIKQDFRKAIIRLAKELS